MLLSAQSRIQESIKDYLEINKETWNQRTKNHVNSKFYDVNGFLQGKGVGIYAVHIAKSYDAEVITVCSMRNIDIVKCLGADRVIDRDFPLEEMAVAMVMQGSKQISGKVVITVA